MDFQHDNVLQRNLCMKELELETLLFHKDFGCSYQAKFIQSPIPKKTPMLQQGGDHYAQQHHQQIHFQNFQYKVFHETKRNHNNRSLGIPPRGHQGLKKDVVPHIPYPLDDAKMDLRSLISMNFLKKPKKPSAYEQIIKRLDSVQFHLKQLATQREKLLMVLQRGHGGEDMMYSKMERIENVAPNCCRYESCEDFAMIIQKATDAIQCSTMETNLYRGMILLVSNNCDSFDSYSSMTSRVMLKEFEECIDDVMTLLNEFIGVHQSLTRFQDFAKHIELLAAVESLITCIRCCASYTWAMESRYGIVASRSSNTSGSQKLLLRTPEKQRDINIGSV